MSLWQSWHWPTDAIPQTQSLEFARSLNSRPMHWEILTCPASGEKERSQFFLSHPTSGLFCVCDSQGRVATSPSNIALWQKRMIAAHALTQDKVGRHYFLNLSGHLRKPHETARLSVLIRSTGIVTWKLWEPDDPGDAVSFRLFDNAGLASFIARSEREVWDALQNALADPQSEAVFARDWTLKTDGEREDRVWNWPRARREELRNELEHWLRCALLADPTLWDQADVWSCSFTSPDSITLYGSEDLSQQPIPASLHEAICQLWHHFSPFNDSVEKYECVRLWKQHKNEWSIDYGAEWNVFGVGIRQPSAHERLEAVLRWRDWLACATSQLQS